MKKGFKELYDEWKELNTLFRIMFIIGIFISVSSITSLSDTIIEWRGFIKEVIDFWHKLTYPLIGLFKRINLDVNQFRIDYFALHSIYASIYIRVVFFLEKNKKDALKTILGFHNKPKNIREKLDKFFDITGRVLIIFPIWVFIFSTIYIYVVGGMLLLSVLLMWLGLTPKLAKSRDKDTKKGIRLFYMNLMIILLCLVVLIAISIGFSSELPE